MGKITQQSRISHHTIAGTAASGLTFSIPTSEDFTDGSWSIYDLALSEIAVNEQDKRVYIRIDDEVKEFQLAGSTSSGDTLAQVLTNGNTSGGNNIIMDSGDIIFSWTGLTLQGIEATTAKVVSLDGLNQVGSSTQSSRVYSIDYNTFHYSYIDVSSDVIELYMDNANVSPQIKMRYDYSLGSEGVIDVSPGGQLNISNVSEGMNFGINNTTNNVGGVHYNTAEVNTSDATTTVMRTIEFSSSTNSLITIEAVVNGWGATNSKAYGSKLFGVFKNVGGTTTLISTVDLTEKTDFSTATSDIEISSNDIVITVTGENSTDINWSVRYNYQISK